MSSNGALEGVLVLDLSRMLPGPYASMILADHGARVIAMEDPRRSGGTIQESTLNRNKEHTAVNLNTEKGREIFYRLAGKADVILEGFRPGVTKRLGIDYNTVSHSYPGIIYCSISGFGQTGPYHDAAGHDVNYQSMAGVLDLIGESSGPPLIPGIQIADMVGGGMNAAIGILMALLERSRTGKGQYIDISMTDGSMSLLTLAFSLWQLTGQAPGRSDFMFSHRYACYNIYETRDGRYISLGAVENHFWRQWCEFFKVPEYADLQYDEDRREEIIEFFRARFREKSLAEWEEVLEGRDFCWAPVRSMEEAVQDPNFREREMVTGVRKKDGSWQKVLGTPVKLDRTPGGVRTPPPGFGEDTARILQEMGYKKSEIEYLRNSDVI